MAEEIERKFLVTGEAWKAYPGVTIRQGYLTTDPERTVRVRTKGEKGYLTVKGITRGATRAEYEYEIPAEDANKMLDTLCHRPLIEKIRYHVPFGEHMWEVDLFFGDNDGLVVAEVELGHEEEEPDLPIWVGEEVTHDSRYFNASLIENPYKNWK